MTAERSSSGVVSCSGRRGHGDPPPAVHGVPGTPASPPHPRDTAVTARARSHLRRRGARPQPAQARRLPPGAGTQGPHLEAAAAPSANGRAPPVHHHHVLGRHPRGAAQARRGLRLRHPPRMGVARQVAQHHLQPPHRATRPSRPSPQHSAGNSVDANRPPPAQARNPLCPDTLTLLRAPPPSLAHLPPQPTRRGLPQVPPPASNQTT